jgi:flagellar M-ring protein FliF
MKKLLASLSVKQRIIIATVIVAVLGGLFTLVRWNRERDFRPLFTGLSPEDAASIVQKLKESGTEYRLPEGGGSVLVPSARLAELRLSMAAAGIPRSGRIGFELFDKTNFGATEFAEHVNYRRALEGELERSVMSLAEVDQARVHLTFPKDSVFLDAQQPAKASVLVRLKPGARLAPQNVVAVSHLMASAVEGLLPEAVSILDMNGNLLSRPHRSGSLDGPEPSEATLDFRRKIENDLLLKVNATLEPLLGAEKFRAGVSVDCDFSGGEQSEEVFDPSKAVMSSSQRTEDTTGTFAASGVPGTASALPRPSSRQGGSPGGVSRVTENITYQTSRMVKRTRMAGGTVKKMSLAVLVDQAVAWERDKAGVHKVLVPPTPAKLKTIRDLVAGVTGLDAARGDQITVESLPFESTLNLEPPPTPVVPATPVGPWNIPMQLNRQQMIVAAIAAGALLLLLAAGAAVMARRRKGRRKATATAAAALPAGAAAHTTAVTKAGAGGVAGAGAVTEAGAVAVAKGATESAEPDIGEKMEAQLAERQAQQQDAENRALNALRLAPVISKTSEILAKHLRETINKSPEVPAHILRSWIREEDN